LAAQVETDKLDALRAAIDLTALDPEAAKSYLDLLGKPITHFPARADGTFILLEGVALPTGEWMYPRIVEQRWVD
jgi:hypothetical protein